MITIYEWAKTKPEDKNKILQRAMVDISQIREYTREWMEKVAEKGDQALLEYAREFDDPQFSLDKLKVKKEEIEAAYGKVDSKVVKAIEKQISISKRVAEARVKESTELYSFIKGVQVGYKITPISSAGLMVPAGQVPLPTVMQILTVNAKAAKVPRIVACYPPTGEYPEMLIAADISGTDEIYRIGGIAGVAALTYGTETIDPVYKIVGPGSKYTQAAKMLAYGKVTIDMVAGPSEAVILADSRANPAYCAADILARAEHAPDASAVLITPSMKLARQTKEEVEKQYKSLTRQEVIKKSLGKYSAIVVVEDMEEAISLTNEYSPEHLEVLMANPFEVLPLLENAGSIFLGDYAPVAVGDYASGTSHILPTGHWSKMSSPVTVETFQKISEIQYLTKEGLENLADVVDIISGVESLDGHWNSVAQRLDNKKRLYDEIKKTD